MPSESRFASRHQGVKTLFSAGGVDFLAGPGRRVAMRFLGARASLPEGEALLTGRANYLKGREVKDWITRIPTFGGLRYKGLYAGIDLVFHGDSTGSELEHDFVLAPGTSPEAIRFTVSGADGLKLGPDGSLAIEVGGRPLVFHRPMAYQGSGQGREPVEASFRVEHGVVSFATGKYDHQRPLTIDPVLSFATYLDGSGTDTIRGLASDASGNIYVVGSTTSTDFPVKDPEQANSMGDSDGFIAKLDPTGHTLIYSTYLGGTSWDEAESVAVDAGGNVVVGGTSFSQDFPLVGKLPTENPGTFIASLDATGTHLRFSGLLGTSATIYEYFLPPLNRVAFDNTGAAYMAGLTHDPNFPITPGAYGGPVAPYPADDTVFLLKVLPDGILAYAATIPENSQPPASDFQPLSIGNLAVDSAGEVILGGSAGNVLPTTEGTLSPLFPNDPEVRSATAGFALKLSASGSELVFSTYVPGTKIVSDIATGPTGDVYLAGTSSNTVSDSVLPTSPNAFLKTRVPRGGDQATAADAGFVLRLSDDGKRAIDATYFSGVTPQALGATVVRAIHLGSNGTVTIAGGTAAPDIPLKNPLTSIGTSRGLVSASSILFIAQLNEDLSTLLFGSLLNASDYDSSLEALTVANEHIVVGGATSSSIFPTTMGSLQPVLPAGATSKNFIASIDLSVPAPSLCFSPSSIDFGKVLVKATATSPVTVTNCGNAPLTLSGFSSTDPTVTASHNCSGIAPGGACQIAVAFSPVFAGAISGTLLVAGNNAVSPQGLSFSGVAGYPQVEVPPSVVFDDVLVGQTAFNGVDFFNQGNGAFILSGATVTGDFHITNNTCTGPVAPDGDCGISISITPSVAGIHTGVLTVTDNLSPSVQMVQLSINALTVAPAPTISGLPAIPAGSSGDKAARVFGGGFLPNSTINWNGSARTTYYYREGLLTADLTAADLAQVGEAEVTVSTPGPGGGTSAKSIATIYGRLDQITVNKEVFDPHSQLIYATVSKDSPTNANSVVAIDPATMKVAKTILSGDGPASIAVSDDGSMLYVGLDDARSVAQVSLPSGVRNFTLKLPPVALNPTNHFPDIVAGGLQVIPGSPHSWLVGMCMAMGEPCGLGISVYDDTTMRPVQYVAYETANSLVFTDDLSMVYATGFDVNPPYIMAFQINANGITFVRRSEHLAYLGGTPLLSDGRHIFDANGHVIDPTTFAVDSTYPQANCADSPTANSCYALDSAQQRVFFAGPNLDESAPGYLRRLVLSVVNKQTQATVGQIGLPENGVATGIEHFGTNGVAINQGPQWLFLRTSLTGASVPITALSFAPGSLTFAAQKPGTSSAAQVVTLTNTGNVAVTISALAVSGDYAATNDCGNAIAAAMSCSISVVFTPSAAGDRSGQLTITHSAADSPQVITLSGTGAAPAPVLSATLLPAALSFGPQTQGTGSAAQSITLTNTGTGALTVTGVSVTGDYTQTNNCGSSVAVAGSCVIMVSFAPTATGDRPGQLTVADDAPGGLQTATLDGTGTQPALVIAATISPLSLSFGSQAQGTTSAAQQVTLANTGTGVLTISAITTTGDYAQTNTCGSSLAVGASCVIAVSFSPTATGALAGQLLIADNAGNSPQTVALSGTGTAAAPPLTLGPQSTGGDAATITAGDTATYQLALTASTYNGAVTLACSGAPVGAACSIAPPALTVSTGTATPFVVTVVTKTAASATLRSGHRSEVVTAGLGALVLLSLPLLCCFKRGRAYLPAMMLACVVVLGTAGCGSGSAPRSTPQGTTVAAGTYQLTITATAGAATASELVTLTVK